MSTGFTLDGFPGIGAWTTYALGSECQDLPAFVAIPDPRGVPQNGSRHWASAFLPAVFQGTPFSADKPIPNLQRPSSISEGDERATRDFLKLLNDRHLAQNPGDSDLAARISAYELAAKMQLAAAEVGEFKGESPATLESYGINDADKTKAGFGRNCLLARRLLERGVRFVQLFNGSYAMGEGVGNWDGHKKIADQYPGHAQVLDQPAAALLRDLKGRGLLDDTLVVFVTEFGRMPTFQKGANGRDHNPKGFTVWLAGAGVKRAFSYGATDEFGYQAVENVTTIYDLHATILHLLGLDHERLSFYNNGIERRLTDVHGHVIKDILS
jgi:membrane-anchored protein YejM (alkaline phosphatase superfamily)